MPRRPSRRSRTATSPAAVALWLTALSLLGGIGWLWWKTAQTQPAPLAQADAGEPPESEPSPDPTPATAPVQVEEPPPLRTETATSAPPVLDTNRLFLPIPPFPGLPTNPPPAATSPPPATVPPGPPPAREKIIAAQLALARRGISSGSIDGILGSQTRAALRTFQESVGLAPTGALDPATLDRLNPNPVPFADYIITREDLDRLTVVPTTWMGKSTRERLDYESILELVAERSHAHPRLIRDLNPGVDWYRLTPDTRVRVPAIVPPAGKTRAALVRISLSQKLLRAYDSSSNLVAQFPCSIARKVEKRPLGRLQVVKVAANPNYRFDPAIFPESEEARRIGRKLNIPPGPNNPVGTAWIGLDRPGYGIHGTPNPEEVGRTESHGCFRLANWNAERLLQLVWVGMPVHVEP